METNTAKMPVCRSRSHSNVLGVDICDVQPMFCFKRLPGISECTPEFQDEVMEAYRRRADQANKGEDGN